MLESKAEIQLTAPEKHAVVDVLDAQASLPERLRSIQVGLHAELLEEAGQP